MVEKYDELMGTSVEAILKSPRLTLNLLKLASACLLAGGQPRGCEKSIRSYYTKLKSEAMRKKIVGLSEKTCRMKPGVFFVAKAQKHYSDANMDDDTARDFLAKGWLKPDMFIKLPAAPEPIPAPAQAEPKAEAAPTPEPAQAEPEAEAAPTPKPAERAAKPKRKRKPSKK
jgi:hypothetical protein